MLAPNFLITYKLKEKKTGRKYGAVKKKRNILAVKGLMCT